MTWREKALGFYYGCCGEVIHSKNHSYANQVLRSYWNESTTLASPILRTKSRAEVIRWILFARIHGKSKGIHDMVIHWFRAPSMPELNMRLMPIIFFAVNDANWELDPHFEIDVLRRDDLLQRTFAGVLNSFLEYKNDPPLSNWDPPGPWLEQGWNHAEARARAEAGQIIDPSIRQ